MPVMTKGPQGDDIVILSREEYDQLIAATNEDASTIVTAIAVTEGAGDTISLATGYAADATSLHGAAITYNGNGTFTYDPNGAAYFEGLVNGAVVTDTFNYTVTDNHGVTSTAVATVTVTITDAKYYKAPWSTKVTFKRLSDTTYMPEEECSEKLLEFPLKPYAPVDGGTGHGSR